MINQLADSNEASSTHNLKIPRMSSDGSKRKRLDIGLNSRRARSSKNFELCPMHKFPLSFLCGKDIICEKWSVEEPYADKTTLNLRTESHQLVKTLEDNFDILLDMIESVEECRTVKIRASILDKVNDYFNKIQKVIDEARQTKIKDVHKTFETLKFENLDDLKIYHKLSDHTRRALKRIK